MPDLIFREGTMDRDIWTSVFENNEYRLPDDMTGQVVLDIGSHIGSFACACKARGAKEVWAAEAWSENYPLALHNFHALPGAATLSMFHAAVFRSDHRRSRLMFTNHDPHNTGCGRTIPAGQIEVPVMQFDDLVKLASDYGRRPIDVAKFDCECAEWPILFTSRGLSLISRIVGEYHCGNFPHLTPEERVEGVEFSLEALRWLLETNGFEVEITPPNVDRYEHFNAVRKETRW